jgi:predicted ATP-grasp superfamily ATP-dependent carboligase
MRLSRFFSLAERTPPAIVLQSSFANGLGIIRGLGRAGVPVLALDRSTRALGFDSRYAAGMLCPDPKTDAEAFLLFLEDLARRLPSKAVVFPTHDEYIWIVSRNAERLRDGYLIPFSDWRHMVRLADKEEQLRAAWRVGVDTPRTVFVSGAGDFTTHANEIEAIGFPCIFKPVESLAFKERFQRPVLKIGSHDELEAVYERVSDCGTLMLQEIVPGDDDELWTLGSYLDAESKPLALFTGRKIRQHPRTFGTARFAESVWAPEFADAGVRLLQELGYHGVSQVESKRDPRDGSFKLMEVNARHWLWHSLATECGVNLSLVAYSDAIGEPFEAPRQTEGKKWMLATKDLPDTLRETVRRESSPAEWLRSLPGTATDGLYSWRDPLPGVKATWRLGALVARRQKARLVRGGKGGTEGGAGTGAATQETAPDEVEL